MENLLGKASAKMKPVWFVLGVVLVLAVLSVLVAEENQSPFWSDRRGVTEYCPSGGDFGWGSSCRN